ncbi:MAG: HAD family phosphatase [Chitinophagaceae bacterium]|nr:MAG: HAD family phosphatase [Chitinophagaceae bacterium]
MPELKNIIFDLGGVLLDIDYGKTKSSFEELGFNNFDEMYSQYSADRLFSDLETGSISNQHFLDHLLTANKGNITGPQITSAWNAMLLHFRLSSLEFLEKLAGTYKLYLLSNTNSIHLEAFNQIFIKETGKASLDSYFTKAYYSNRVGLRKPNEDIFEFVLKDAGIEAGETLFIDDSYNNIETAKKMGFKTHLLVPGEKIEQLEYV